MKKNLLIAVLVVLTMALTGSYAMALSGPCSACHTMHNSQNNSTMQFDFSPNPQGYLLRGSCWSCHAQLVAVNITADGIPQVNHTNATDLAGGNFAYITTRKALTQTSATSDNVGHNVIDSGNTDNTLTAPPGDNLTSGVTQNNLTCAGQFGCHGARGTPGNNAAMVGAHHNNVGASLTTASTVGNSYRFLNGVHGYESTDWEATATSGGTNHNVYKGATAAVAGSLTAPGGNTISGLCNECHGQFHGGTAADTGTGSPWLRHPTDVAITANGGEYATISTTYNIATPIALADVSAQSGTFTASDAIVMCLSCHRAHASQYMDSLRWDYATIATGGGSDTTRCFVCHTSKDGVAGN